MYSIIGTYTNNKMVLYIIHTAHPRKVVAYIYIYIYILLCCSLGSCLPRCSRVE